MVKGCVLCEIGKRRCPFVRNIHDDSVFAGTSIHLCFAMGWFLVLRSGVSALLLPPPSALKKVQKTPLQAHRFWHGAAALVQLRGYAG